MRLGIGLVNEVESAANHTGNFGGSRGQQPPLMMACFTRLAYLPFHYRWEVSFSLEVV